MENGAPTTSPTDNPTRAPTTDTEPETKAPTTSPTRSPVAGPVTPVPTKSPTKAPTSAPTTTESKFDITFQFEGVPEADKAIFTSAANRWEQVIVVDRPDASLAGFQTATGCDNNLPAAVDDLHICSRYEDIDGPNQVLGFAGPRVVTDELGLPRTLSGDMVFDTADIERLRNDGELVQVILHEMGHVLGLGTLWEDASLTTPAPTCTYNFNSKASEQWRSISGCGAQAVPVETDGGPGTACGHWDEICMRDELMTGFLSGTVQKLSTVTVGGLEDLGYGVSYAAADNLTPADLDPSCVCGGGRRQLRRKKNGNHKTRHNKKKSSDEGEKLAQVFGKAILEARKRTNDAMLRDGAGINLSDKGEDFVIVFYDEGGTIQALRVDA